MMRTRSPLTLLTAILLLGAVAGGVPWLAMPGGQPRSSYGSNGAGYSALSVLYSPPTARVPDPDPDPDPDRTIAPTEQPVVDVGRMAARGPVRFEPDTCPFNNITAVRIECGWLIVPEDHAAPAGRHIRLAIAIIKATGADPLPDPILYLAGGPGGGTVWMAPQMAVSLAQSRRDVVLIDQRGMGNSQPGLYCPAISDAMLMSDVPIEGLIRECRAAFDAQGIQVGQYTTAQNAADIAAARSALGYAAVNLYGVSYGTRLALVVLRDHPQGIRSVTLDSTHPPTLPYSGTDALNGFERGFEMLVTYCDADVICRTAYPNLRQTYLNLFQRLNAAPVSIAVAGQRVVVTGNLLRTLVYTSLYRPASLVTLPALITSTANGDEELLREALTPLVRPASGQGRSMGSTLTVLCTEMAGAPDQRQASSAPQVSAGAAVNPAFSDPIPAIAGDNLVQNCRAWGVAERALLTPAVNDTVPVLILAGEHDPVTPPQGGEVAAATLGRSHLVRFPYSGHGLADSACGGAIYAQFLEDPAAAPNTSCTRLIPAPAFVLSAGATRPLVTALTAILSLIGLAGVAGASRAVAAQPRWTAWRVALHRAGWLPVVLTLALLVGAALGVGRPPSAPFSLVEALAGILPLVAAIQVAFVFAPDSEPALEAQLGAPRPLAWLVGERVLAILLTQGVLGLLVTGIALAQGTDQSAWVLVSRWLSPLFFFAAISLYVTLRSRVPLFGALVAALLWFAFAMVGDYFLPGQPFAFPVNVVQPFLWMLHTYLEPAALGLTSFAINRLSILALGLVLFMLAFEQVRSEEAVLLGEAKPTRRPRRALRPLPAQANAAQNADQRATQHTPHLPASPTAPIRAVWVAQPTRHDILAMFAQVAAIIRYEFALQWRQRTVLVLTIAICVMVLLGTTVFSTALSGALNINPASLSPERARLMNSLIAAMGTWAVVSIIVGAAAALAAADAVPHDGRTGTMDLFNGLPLPYPVYLAGKALGALAAIGAGAVVALLVSMGLWQWRYGSLDWATYLDMWIVGVGGLMALNVPLAVLVGASQPTRGRAVLACLALYIAPLLLGLLGGEVWGMINPMRGPLFNHYLSQFAEVVLDPARLSAPSGITVRGVQLSLLIGLVEVVVAAWIAWRVHRLRTQRA